MKYIRKQENQIKSAIADYWSMMNHTIDFHSVKNISEPT